MSETLRRARRTAEIMGKGLAVGALFGGAVGGGSWLVGRLTHPWIGATVGWLFIVGLLITAAWKSSAPTPTDPTP